MSGGHLNLLIFVEVAGWSGAVLILLAYLLLSMDRLTGQSAAYQWMNVVGAAGFIVNGLLTRISLSADPNRDALSAATAMMR